MRLAVQEGASKPDRRVQRMLRYVPLAPLALVLLMGTLLLFGSVVPARAAPHSRAQELISEVNALRSEYGLAPYRVDPILMSVAQAQNEYRLAAGITSHVGPDGSRPRERAAAAGYGEGATIFISENIADGTGLTPAVAVEWWRGDDPHLNTMIGPNYVHVGAGAGETGGVWRYTLMAGYVAGGSYTPSQAGAAAAPSGPVIRAIISTSTPTSEGAIIHIVAEGQTLWTIAAIYEVELNELMELNGFSDTPLLHAGDEVIVRAASTATPTQAPSPTATDTPEPSPTPTQSETPAATEELTATATPEQQPPVRTRSPLSLALMAAGGLLIAAGALAALRSSSD